jgi:hypothetical protein
MKKTLLSASFAIATVAAMAQATCTPDVSCLPATNTQGVCPDSASAVALLTGTVGTPMNVTFSFKIPSTVVVSGITATVVQLAVENIQAKVGGVYGALSVVGLNYLGAGTNTSSVGTSPITMTKYCYFPAPAPAGKCVLISGTPTMAGVFPIKIISQGQAQAFGQLLWQQLPEDNSYYLTINPTPNGLASTIVNSTKFGVIAANPNPFSDNTSIIYNSPESAKTTFTVFNVLGKEVYSNSYAALAGQNTIDFKSNNLTSGVYIYTLSNGKEKTTQRFVIEK